MWWMEKLFFISALKIKLKWHETIFIAWYISKVSSYRSTFLKLIWVLSCLSLKASKEEINVQVSQRAFDISTGGIFKGFTANDKYRLDLFAFNNPALCDKKRLDITISQRAFVTRELQYIHPKDETNLILLFLRTCEYIIQSYRYGLKIHYDPNQTKW